MADDRAITLPPKPNLRVAEVAKYLDVSLQTVYDLIASGEIPSKRIGRQIKIPREAFVKWYEKKCRDGSRD